MVWTTHGEKWETLFEKEVKSVEVVNFLLIKHKNLSSNSSTTKTNQSINKNYSIIYKGNDLVYKP